MVSRFYQLMRRKYPLSPERETHYARLEEMVGNTQLVSLKGLRIPNGNEIYAKLEYENPTGSHFDRIYVALLRRAEHKGLIVPKLTPLIEVTSGNAGAAFAYAAKNLGMKHPIIVMPGDSHPARVKQLEKLGAKIVLSEPGRYILGSIDKGRAIVQHDHSQKEGKLGENPEKMLWVSKTIPEGRILYHPIADEAFVQARERGVNSFDCFISVAATGTTISGIGARMLHYNPHLKIFAVDHEKTRALAHLLASKNPKPAEMQKIFGFTPLGTPLDKMSFDARVLENIRKNGVLHVSNEELSHYKHVLNTRLGFDVGVTGIAALVGALKLSRKVKRKKILILFSNEGWKDSEHLPSPKA